MIDMEERTKDVFVAEDDTVNQGRTPTVTVPPKGKLVDAYELERQKIAEDPIAWATKQDKILKDAEEHQRLKKIQTEKVRKDMEARKSNPRENGVGYLIKEPDAEGKERHFLYKEDALMYLVNRVGMSPADANKDFNEYVITLSTNHAFSGIPPKK